MKNALIGLAFVAAVGVMIPVVAEATMSKPTPVPPESRMEIVLQADVSHETYNSKVEMVRSLFSACRLQVPTDPQEGRFEQVRDRFRFVIQPALNESDRRQFRGCLEDLKLQHLEVDVLWMRRL